MNIQQIDLNKLFIILFVGICAVIGVYYQLDGIPEVCLGGLIGYLSKDIQIPTTEDENNEYEYEEQ